MNHLRAIISHLRAYAYRFATEWVATDPAPTYSPLDLRDNLGAPTPTP